MPGQALVTPDDAAARLAHHVAGVEAAMRDLFPSAKVEVIGNCLDGGHVHYQDIFSKGPSTTYACIGAHAGIFPRGLP
jgi:hypothetical protein